MAIIWRLIEEYHANVEYRRFETMQGQRTLDGTEPNSEKLELSRRRLRRLARQALGEAEKIALVVNHTYTEDNVDEYICQRCGEKDLSNCDQAPDDWEEVSFLQHLGWGIMLCSKCYEEFGTMFVSFVNGKRNRKFLTLLDLFGH